MKEMIKKELSKTDFIDVLREGKKSDYHLDLKKYFGGLDRLVQIQQEWPIFEGNNARFHLEDYMELKGYKLSLFSYVDDGALFQSRFSDIEYAPGKYKNCIEDGNFWVTSKKDPKVSFLLNSRTSKYDKAYDLNITCVQGHTKVAEDLIRDFREYIREKNIYKKQKFRGDLSFIKHDKVYTWDDLILNEETFELLQHNLLTVLTRREIYNSFGVSHKRGVILAGSPGTGKTLVGKILCSLMKDWSFLWISPGDLQRIDTLKSYCSLAREIAPTILFLEDLDLHFQSRDANAQNSLLGELMNQLDGIDDVSNIIVIGTTNRPGDLEAALAKRPGRFDKIINFEVPDKPAIKRMLENFGGDRLSKDIDWDKVLTSAVGMSGAQVKEVLTQAILKLLDNPNFKESQPIKFTTEDLLRAVKVCKKKDFSPQKVGFMNEVESAFD